MSAGKYFTDLCPTNQSRTIMEADRLIDTRDTKWRHPAAENGATTPWYADSMAESAYLYNPDVSIEDKVKMSVMVTEAMQKANMAAAAGVEPKCDVTSYTVPGCPEEPDHEVEVRVYRPKDLKKKKARCMFYCLGGALVHVAPEAFPIDELAARYNCVVVVPLYRKSFEAQYPAAINDLHAGYKWMMEHTEDLQIHPDNVMLFGCSSGGHLALAFGFRLKRYGYDPKGIVALVPQTDDREDELLSVYNGWWDSETQHNALAQWLGRDFGSNRVGPEALANHATVKDCIGYPPTFIHTVEFDPDRNYSRQFYGKLLEAKSFAEFHCWGGANHGTPWDGVSMAGELTDYTSRVRVIVDANVNDCFKYDLRRPWVKEEA